MRASIVPLIVVLSAVAYAQPVQQPQRPTAVQIVAQHLAVAITQNAELLERIGALEDQVTALRRQLAEKADHPKPPQN